MKPDNKINPGENPEVKRFQTLLMMAVDEALNPEEQREFDAFLKASPEYQKEWDSMRAMKSITNKMVLKKPAKEVWDMYWTNTYNRLERGLSWLLITIGAVVLTGYSGYVFIESFFPDPKISLIVKAGVVLLLGGIMALSLSVLREKIFTHKRDPYKEVER